MPRVFSDELAKADRDMKHPMTVGSRTSPSPYSDMYPFVFKGVPASTMMSTGEGTRAGRGLGAYCRRHAEQNTPFSSFHPWRSRAA
ncbi:MAG: hypothetical protein AB1445_14730 [Bacillota bacterium]